MQHNSIAEISWRFLQYYCAASSNHLSKTHNIFLFDKFLKGFTVCLKVFLKIFIQDYNNAERSYTGPKGFYPYTAVGDYG